MKHKHTVLVIEDEEELREMTRDALERAGYAVVAVGDGQAALDSIASIEHLCLVLLDLVMPRMNGWEFFSELRARPGFANVPVVVQSSATDQAPVGVTRVVKKPVKLDRLLSMIREFCAQ